MIPGIVAGAKQTAGVGPLIADDVSTVTGAASAHNINMPAAVAGDIIVVALGTTNAPSITIDTGVSGTGWTVQAYLTSTGGARLLWAATKVAAGGGGDALRLTFGASNGVNCNSYAVRNAAVVRSASAAFAAPGSNTANPPSVGSIPSDSPAVCLVVGAFAGSFSTASAPAGYGLDFQVSGRFQSFSAVKSITGTTEDPAAYNPGGNAAHALATLVLTAA